MDLENVLNQFVEDMKSNNYGAQFLGYPLLCNALIKHMTEHISKVNIADGERFLFQNAFAEYNRLLQNTSDFINTASFNTLLEAAKTGIEEDITASLTQANKKRQELQELTATHTRMNELRTEIQRITEDIAYHEREKKALGSIDELTSMHDSLKARQDLLHREFPRLREDVSRYKELENGVSQNITSIKDQYTSLIQSFDQSNQQSLYDLSSLESDITTLTKEIDTTRAKIAELRNTHQDLVKNQTEAIERLKTYTSVNQRLVDAFGSDAHTLKDKLHQIEGELSQIDGSIKALVDK